MGRTRVQAANNHTKSARHLVLGKGKAHWNKHQRQQQQQQLLALSDAPPPPSDENPGDDAPPKLPPGHEQLFSLFAPALKAGSHTIAVKQHITPPAGASTSKPLNLTASKALDVVAPRFWLPASDIHSVYPPQGHGDHNNILPHVVFADEHLPWERAVSGQVEAAPERNRVPWLALLVFTQDELRLPAQELVGGGRIFPADVVQSTTLSVSMTLNDIWAMAKLDKIISPIIQDDPVEKIDPLTASTKTDFIFVKKDMIDMLFRSYNADGSRNTAQSTPDLVKYKYLSHVRNLNTEGMTNVGGVDEFGEAVDQLFSVIVAHRAGPWDAKAITPVVVHLVSLEGIEPRINLTTLAQSDIPYVSLCSLYSWTYQCLPNDSINFYDAMVHLGNKYQPLRLLPPPAPTQSGPAADRVIARLRDGFTLARWRVKSGETTAAMVRGPFVPTTVPRNPQGVQSTFSSDLQILDRQTGVMDVSYSLAWQLGKTMAIADQAFTAAVARLRGIIHDQALQAVKNASLGARRKTALDVVSNLERDVQLLGSLHHKGHALDPLRKWKRAPAQPLPQLGFFDAAIQDTFLDEAKKVAKQLASSLDAPAGQCWFYNEHNRPYSTDWALMLKWLLDRMYFVGIPAHYLITDPAHLPGESLRFFSIDANWVDALVDGALSICCHLEPEDDDIRTAIKETVEEFRQLPDPVLGYPPQIPTYGFLLRSAVVKMFPDLVVSAPYPDQVFSPRTKSAPILRQENIDEQVMLVLFDRQPGDGFMADLVISQPPHQQCFAAAVNIGLDADKKQTVFEISYEQIFTTDNQPTGDARKVKLTSTPFYQDGNPCPVFDWDSRMMIVQNYAQNILSTVQSHMPKSDFDDTVPSAALMGIQLNDPMYQLTFDLSKGVETLASALALTAQPHPIASGKKVKGPGRVRRSREAKSPPTHSSHHAHHPRHSHHPHHPHHQPHHGAKPSHGPAAPSGSYKSAQKPPPKAAAKPAPRAPAPHAKLLGVSTAREHMGPIRTNLAATAAAVGAVSPTQAVLSISCKVHGQKAPNIATNAGYSIDLVFGSQVTGDVNWLSKNGFLFTGLFIYLPLYAAPASSSTGSSSKATTAAPAPAPPAGKFLTAYQGGGARMLANLRFNPLLFPNKDRLTVSLFPRTASGGVDLKASGHEMGFVLGEVDIVPYATPQLPVAIAFMERYVQKDDPQKKPVYVNGSFSVKLAPV